MKDFHNPDAPLKVLLDTKPGERGKGLWSLLKDPATAARAIEAMERRGMDTSEIKKLAEKYRNPEDLEKDIRDAIRLEHLGEKEFSRQMAAATRKAVLRWTLKAFCYVAGTLAVVWLLVILVRVFGRRM